MPEPFHRTLRADVIPTAVGPVEVARCGEGPPLLLIHGTPGTWRQVAGLARDLADEHTVLLPSRPGYGRSPLASGRTPADHARAYAALLDELGFDTAAAIGVSGGGPSAAQLAQLFPTRTRALVLCCALAPHLLSPPLGMRLALGVPGLAEVGSPLQRWVQRRALRDDAATDRRIHKELQPAERAQLAADPSVRDSLVGFFWSHLDAPSPVAGLRNDLRSLGFAPGGAAPDLSGVTAPTLVLHGDADPVVPLTHGECYAHTIAGARLEVLPGAGHAFIITFRTAALDLVRVGLRGT